MDEETQEIEEQESIPIIDPKIIERATRQGWSPKEEFRGDPERWITANEFVERADNIMPILKSVNSKLESKMAELEKQLKEQKEITKKVAKIQGKYSQDFYDSKVSELKIQKLKAVEDGNTELYVKLDDEERKISTPEPVGFDESNEDDLNTGLHPDVVRWKDDNKSWYGTDSDLTEYADIIADRMARKGHGYTTSQFLEEVKKKVQTMFPNKFTNPNRNTTFVDESATRGSETTNNKNKKTWNNLPDDAKEHCLDLIASMKLAGKEYTKETYIKEYYEGEE